MVIPYLAPLRWYTAWFGALLEGNAPEIAIAHAAKLAGLKGKDFSRCTLPANGRPLTLSVAIEGGAHSLRNPKALAAARISLHGNWPHVHLGALEALYGRSPWYPHVMPAITAILNNVPERLDSLNLSLHDVIASFIHLPADPGGVSDSVMARGKEAAAPLDPDASIIDTLMRLGPDTALALLYSSKTLL